MRDSAVFRKAIMQRVKDRRVGRYLSSKDLEPANQRLIVAADSLQRADELVLWDVGRSVGYWMWSPNAHPAG